MKILTIEEAAIWLRITRRTLYRRKEIPRVRIGHKIMFLQQDLETWVQSRREVREPVHDPGLPLEGSKVDGASVTSYHRNPLFRKPSGRP